MAFHITNFGAFGSDLSRFADIDGYVPVDGDDWREMNFDLSGEDLSDPDVIEYLDEEWWPEFVASAESARKEAAAALEDWQQNNS